MARPSNLSQLDILRTPPAFCQYADGPCDQVFESTPETRGIFLYPSEPEQIAATIEATVSVLRRMEPITRWQMWKDFHTTGQIIFCSICKAMRFSEVIIADVTTLSFNLLFEIGFALGLGLPVIPIRDTTFIRDRLKFEELGLLDTVGYLDFQNSDILAHSLLRRLPQAIPVPAPPTSLNRDAPIYVLKGHIDTEGAVRLMSTLKKSALRFRTHDVVETPRLSLQEARKQVASSLAVVAHLLSPDREGHLVHNARCALVAGLAMASAKIVLLLQEGHVRQPIDYRQIVSTYTNPNQIPTFLERLIRQVVSGLQDVAIRPIRPPEKLLERLDLGDVAAENEIQGLRSYFIQTAQFNAAKRGHARLVIGRKGSGKTAIFYAIRDSFGNRRSHLVLDLKPEGHQFTKLREAVLSQLTPGLQEHTIAAFWNYILLGEMAQKIIDYEYSWASRDPQRKEKFDLLVEVHRDQTGAEPGDFSERLLRQVDRLTERYQSQPLLTGEALTPSQLTGLLFRGDIPKLDDAVGAYLSEKEEVWLLVDNLDKGWPTRGSSSEDILILRSLLEATRKLQRQFERRNVGFHCLVFLRNDIYEHLILETPDRGKDTGINVDWDDPETFKELVRRRLQTTTGLSGSFLDLWSAIFDSHVGTQDSFQYIADRTLMRPRDLLNFLHRSIEVAVNRGHERVLGDDILKAEVLYSEDILLSTIFELRDVYPDKPDALYEFLGCPTHMTKVEVLERLAPAGFDAGFMNDALGLLLWFGFLGIQEAGQEEPRFAYQMRYNLTKLLSPIERGRGMFVIHPAFRKALECSSRS